MSRLWFLLLAVSIGLNAGLLYMQLSRPEPPQRPWEREGRGRFDGPPPFEMEDVMARHRDRLADRLGLDDAQREKLASIHEKLAPAMGERRQAMMNLRQEMAEAFAGDTVDTVRVRELIGQVSAQQAELDSVVVETMLSETGLLSPEQRRLFLESTPFLRGPGGGGPQGRLKHRPPRDP